MATKRCLRCEAEISTTANWCRSCGSKQSRKSGLKNACIVAGSLFIGMVALCSAAVAIIALNTGTAADEGSQAGSSPKKAPAPLIPVYDLAVAYDGNKLAADAQYKGKVFKIKGVPSDIGNAFGDPHVAFDTGLSFMGVTCEFGRSWTDRLAAVELGREITVQGRVTGHLLFSVGVVDCILLE